MQVGLQTISWDSRQYKADSRRMIRDIKASGFDGIELAQVKDDFSCTETFLEALESENVDLIGVAGGSLQDKFRLVAQFHNSSKRKNNPYMYADNWTTDHDEQYRNLLSEYPIAEPITVAIHPHMFKPIQSMREALQVTKEFDYTKLLIDTAHITIAGDDVLDVVSAFLDQIIAIHLKDWSPEFGRTLPFYSRGFVELGRGRIPIVQLLEHLKQSQYSGWLVVEQDYAPDPAAAARRSREFLREHGI